MLFVVIQLLTASLIGGLKEHCSSLEQSLPLRPGVMRLHQRGLPHCHRCRGLIKLEQAALPVTDTFPSEVVADVSANVPLSLFLGTVYAPYGTYCTVFDKWCNVCECVQSCGMHGVAQVQ